MAKTVFVSGHFNILHTGHIRLLQFAKELGDILVVGVESDRIAGAAAHINEKYRLEGVKLNNLVDDVILVDEPIISFVKKIRPDVIVKGKEHELSFNPEKAILDEYGGKLFFSSGETIFSSLELINKEFELTQNNIGIKMPTEFQNRHKINENNLIEILNKFTNLNVCVIGDLIIDEYISCQALGMSQEDPTIVISPIDSRKFIGGAGIVAAHAAGLGANVNFISVVGKDSVSEYAREKLFKYKVNFHLEVDSNRPTTLKQRYRCSNKTMLRVSHLHQNAISVELQDNIYEHILSIIDKINVLVFSDFNYGCLPQDLVDKIISLAKSRNVFLAADSQSSSQIGDISRFENINLITPTETEARISTRNKEDGLIVMADKLKKISNPNSILLKLGENGLLVHTSIENQSEWLTDKIEALNQFPKDVSGAGDSLLITSSMALACGANIWESALLGSLAAAIQVSRVGNIPLQLNELLEPIHNR
jgi:rfaE bifunctional protein kinase chain/domain